MCWKLLGKVQHTSPSGNALFTDCVPAPHKARFSQTKEWGSPTPSLQPAGHPSGICWPDAEWLEATTTGWDEDATVTLNDWNLPYKVWGELQTSATPLVERSAALWGTTAWNKLSISTTWCFKRCIPKCFLQKCLARDQAAICNYQQVSWDFFKDS